MEASPLSLLPGEIRNSIYDFAFTSSSKPHLQAQEPALTRSCRRLRNESLLLHFCNNDFQLVIPRNEGPLYAKRLQRFGREKVDAIPAVEIVYHLPSNGTNHENGWKELAQALVGCGFRKDQVKWRMMSISFSNPSLGWNYYMYLAEAARLNMYSRVVTKAWEDAFDAVAALV